MQTLAALEIAVRFVGHLPRLLDLRVHFGELDLREALALLHLLPFAHANGLDDARRL